MRVIESHAVKVNISALDNSLLDRYQSDRQALNLDTS